MQVSASELRVLEILWIASPLTVGQVIERVRADVDWHDNTIKTLLTRLVGKSAVTRQRDGGRYFYRPTVTREEVVTSEVENLLSRFFGGRMQHLVAYFADNSKLTDDDVRELQALLERLNDK